MNYIETLVDGAIEKKKTDSKGIAQSLVASQKPDKNPI
jgi:hypothetical protein